MNNLVLIIGGTSGIGLETANYLLKKDYRVIVSGRKKIKLDKIHCQIVDINSDISVKKLHRDISKNFGDIEALVYCAGISSKKEQIENFDEKTWNNTINTNVTGFLRTIKYFFPSLKKTEGKVVAVNSIAGRSYSQFSGIEYTASKAALRGVVKHLASDWFEHKIFINSVFPSMTSTPMLNKKLNKDQINDIKDSLPLKKLAEPFDTARAIEFLICKENKYITGTGIDISGGQILNG
tara:strand:+ start:48126 stop:48836 length:711 start_codon:yes stop_codon:yes gene_type:complete